ncbi:hypothetical protein HDU98_002716 [Podochytrium sp. JEL0797]|nr:hypothetical protein HDU98_002716 [Podochytrium sp. JEL0797]
MSVAYPGTYTLINVKCTGSVITSADLVKPWDDGCLKSFTLTQAAIDANTGNKGDDAIFGAVFNTPPGLSGCGDSVDFRSRVALYFPPNVIKAWSGLAAPFSIVGQNGQPDMNSVYLVGKATFVDSNAFEAPGCSGAWTLDGGIPAPPPPPPPPPPPAATTKPVEVVPTADAGQVVPTSAAGSNGGSGAGDTGGGSNGGSGSTGGDGNGSGSTSTTTNGTSGMGSAIANGTLVSASVGVKSTATATGEKASTTASNAGSLTALSAVAAAFMAFILLV